MKHIVFIIAITLLTAPIHAQNGKEAKSVLLITSAQVDLLSEDGKAWGLTKDAEAKNKVRENLKRVLIEARKRNIPIIHSPVGFDYEKMKGYQPLNAIQGVIVQNQLLDMNSDGVAFIPEARPLKKEQVLPFRQGFSSFWADSVQEHLEKLGVDTIYIAGMLAEGCVESHARDAAENGYKTIVISDAIGSTSLELLDASYKTLALHTATMITTQEFLTKD
ncbi:cysteine hydrolase [Flagellimonas sp.]|uniref:cysteine hydrolase n=1 Tax=Flagellimonas sp. TaxID=2058762 RepID=UPI003B51E3DF